MLPFFKSHYSVGKSILTLNPPSSGENPGATSVFDIATQKDLSHVFLVEDSLIGFLEAHKRSQDLGINMSFGLRLTMCDDMSKKPVRGVSSCEHKIIIFALDGDGCVLLNKIYSAAQTQGYGRIDSLSLKSLYDSSHLKIVIPFYDSFLFENTFSYKEPCLLDHSFFTPTFVIENNLLPFDSILKDAVIQYAGDQFEIMKAKTIYYENRCDFEAYQTYKCICGRGFSNKAKTLDMPNLDHCGSPEFCYESYLENESS